jgi:hypothetical protein
MKIKNENVKQESYSYCIVMNDNEGNIQQHKLLRVSEKTQIVEEIQDEDHVLVSHVLLI